MLNSNPIIPESKLLIPDSIGSGSRNRYQSGIRYSRFKDLAGLGASSIIIYGGTFDPPHIVHYNIAKHLKRLADLVVVIPTAHNPLKSKRPAVSDQDRLNMLDAMLKDESDILVLSNEIDRSKNNEISSKTIDTLMEAKNELPDTKIMFALGIDCLPRLNVWDRWEELFQLAEIVPISRDCSDCKSWEEVETALGSSYTSLLKAKLISHIEAKPTSSTEIRQQLASGAKLEEGILPEAVEKYIKERGLYLMP